jgi:hypothetical protein
MSPDTLTRADQLRIEARSIITQGRYPFRKVTTDSRLLTREGCITPDLIFWINRDSCIAGGCVFFSPEDNIPAHIFKQGQACADALALNQFATWSPTEIVIWQADTLEKRFEMHPHSDLDALTELLDQFKILAVIEAKSNSELTSWHLSNLCLQSVNKGIPGLSAYLRRKNLSDSESATFQARAKLMLCVARMLTALHAGSIPAGIKPELLDSTLKDLTDAPRRTFAVEAEPELDKKSSILLHNLLRRLGQIRPFQEDPQRARAMLDQILDSTNPQGCSLMQPSFDLPAPQVSVYTPEVCRNTIEIEIDTGTRLLLKNLARATGDTPQRGAAQYEEVFSLSSSLKKYHIHGCFFSKAKPDTPGTDMLNTHMRMAWPGRRIHLTKSTPMGLWQFTYILGISGEGSSIYARLSPELFQASGCDKVLELIHSCTTLAGAAYIPEQKSVELLVYKSTPDDTQTTFTAIQTRRLNWHKSTDFVADFCSALNLNTRHESSAATPHHGKGTKQQNLRQQLFHELDSQGLPEFPAGYIYNIAADELEEFVLDQTPWYICQNFMGSYSLCNAQGTAVQEATGAKAHALVLASHLHQRVFIPRSEEQCRSILTHYLEELGRVYMHILEEAHAHLKTSAAAKRFGNKFWKELPLPPWQACQNAAELLGCNLQPGEKS